MCLSGAQEGSDEEDASAEEAGSAEGWKPANKICSCFLGFVEARDPWKMPDEPSSSSWENPRRKPWEQACTAMVEPEASKAMLFLGRRQQGLGLEAQGEGAASLRLFDFCCCSRPVSGDLDGLQARPLQGFPASFRDLPGSTSGKFVSLVTSGRPGLPAVVGPGSCSPSLQLKPKPQTLNHKPLP